MKVNNKFQSKNSQLFQFIRKILLVSATEAYKEKILSETGHMERPQKHIFLLASTLILSFQTKLYNPLLPSNF